VARGHLQAGEYQKAIDVYHAGYQKSPGDQKLLDAYVQALDHMAASANQALDRQAVGAAGKTYDILLKNYVRFSGFEGQLAFTPASLNEKLNYCKKTLFKQGFEEYRKGNLSQSIALWEDLLVIDPRNADIKEALRIAKLQQKNLHETE
jgi:tetratricopeptide (TPR) repeat protein